MKKLIKFVIKKLFGQAGIEFCRKLYFIIPKFICALFPMQDEIIFESHLDFTDNTYELYRYMVKQGLQNKFKLTWLVNNPEQYKNRTDIFGDLIEIEPADFKGWWKKYFRCNRAKVFIGCNRHVQKLFTGREQLNIYLTHGDPIKDVTEIYGHPVNFCDYLLESGKFFSSYQKSFFNVRDNQIIYTGFPRNDCLVKPSVEAKIIIKKFLGGKRYIVWAPTFRQHKNGIRVDSNFILPLGIPIIYNEKIAKEINANLVSQNMFLIIKPHPAQDLRHIKDLALSNIKFVYDEDLQKLGIIFYDLLAHSLAMITDWSSVYFDYLLTDKPIGLTKDDIREFDEKTKFLYKDLDEIIVGKHIFNKDDFIKFIENVSAENDELLDKRIQIKIKTHEYIDANSCQRVYEWVLKKIHERGWI